MSLESTEKECAANATAPRVSLADIEAAIAQQYYFTAGEALRGIPDRHVPDDFIKQTSFDVFTICLLAMNNGFCVIGKAAPASKENFDVALGRKLAYEDAVRQLWPLMGYSLRDRLSAQLPPGTIYRTCQPGEEA